MPPRGKRPGFKIGRTLKNGTRLPYWYAGNVVRNPMGFPDKCIPLPIDADDMQIAELCQVHTARLLAWIEAQQTSDEPGLPRYDGSVLSACQFYQKHPRSHFHKVKPSTRKTYTDSLKVIEGTVGARLIRRLTVIDCEYWYEQWRKGVVSKDAEGNDVIGPERIDRAHDAIAMFRTVLRFLAALRHPDCKQLAEELKLMQFEKGGAREEEMTYAHATAFIKKALELGQAGTIPYERGLYMAIGVAAQFELLLRQMDIIGEWHLTATDAQKATKKGALGLRFGEETWTGFFTWERIPGWRWRMKTSKSKYRSAAEFDLTKYSLLFPLLEAVPHEQREGAIIKGEHVLPIRVRSYRNWFRTIKLAAGIPDEVWNMDARAGGATEAEESGAGLEAIQGALTHSKKETTLRYIRTRSTKIAAVADARSKKRAADEGSK
jgi:hypothetical protein